VKEYLNSESRAVSSEFAPPPPTEQPPDAVSRERMRFSDRSRLLAPIEHTARSVDPLLETVTPVAVAAVVAGVVFLLTHVGCYHSITINPLAILVPTCNKGSASLQV
jgi:hypothetical protein